MDAQVAIVGCGPIGALLGNLLGRRGISTVILEKQKQPYNLPRAIHFDGEAMRVFQAADLTEEILPSTMVGKGMLFKTMDGELLIDWSRAQEIGPMGWYESYRVHQPGLEAALLAGLDRFEHVQLVRDASVVSVEQDSDGANVTLANGSAYRAEYVIGADGANSMVRDAMGAEVDALGFEERWLVVDLTLKVPREDLGDYSIQFCDPDNPATYVRGVGERRRWEMRLKDSDPDDPPDALVWDRLSRWITPQEAELERKAVYTFRSIVAKQWREGRLLLAGDAAHQMPPFMGQGMCAGIRDAGNLVWKLDHALKSGRDAILDSYFSEREVNVRQFIELSVRLGKLINQSACGSVPKGEMKSIWPCLGPGLGERDGVGGELAPQVRTNGVLADDAAKHGFYVLAHPSVANDFDACSVPVFAGHWNKFDGVDTKAALIRPDGYGLAAVASVEEVEQLLGSRLE